MDFEFYSEHDRS